MSKVSLNMYTKLLAERLPQITVSSFDPGWVKTNMGTQNAKKLPSETALEIYELISMKKKAAIFGLMENQGIGSQLNFSYSQL